jgi:transcriptional regulator of arginine metabolism
MNNYTKQARQDLLREIIAVSNIGDQHHLLDELNKRSVRTTQATISRDLQEMGLVKVRVAPGVYKYEALESASKGKSRERLMVMFRSFVTDIKGTKNMVLVKTTPGNANGLAGLIDNEEYHEILGTVAGDDTIIVIVKTERARRKVEYEFKKLRG